jgi:hypothetical protein
MTPKEKEIKIRIAELEENNQQKGNDFIADVMQRFYQEIAKDYKVHTDRILLAITDNGKYFQAYIINEEETELRYLNDYNIPNGA